MNKRYFVGLCVAVLASVPLAAGAAQLTSGSQPSLPAGPIADDVYVFGGNVSSNASVTGDLAAGGGNILINGSVSGDAAIGGGSVTVLAAIGDDLRVGGGNIMIAGSVGGDLVAGGGQVQLAGDGVGGDVLWAGGTLRIEAPVAGDLELAGGEVFINSAVTGNIVFKGDKLTFGSGARITGTVTYSSPKQAVIEEGAVVPAEMAYTPLAPKKAESFAALAAIFTLSLLVGIIVHFVASLIVVYFVPRYATTLLSTAFARPLAEMGRGIVVLIVMPVLAFILFVTVVGIPFGLLALVGYIALLTLTWIVAPIVLGSLVYSWIVRGSGYQVNWRTVALGAIVYALLGLIPFIGWIAVLCVTVLTLGSIVKVHWGIVQEWR